MPAPANDHVQVRVAVRPLSGVIRDGNVATRRVAVRIIEADRAHIPVLRYRVEHVPVDQDVTVVLVAERVSLGVDYTDISGQLLVVVPEDLDIRRADQPDRASVRANKLIVLYDHVVGHNRRVVRSDKDIVAIRPLDEVVLNSDIAALVDVNTVCPLAISTDTVPLTVQVKAIYDDPRTVVRGDVEDVVDDPLIRIPVRPIHPDLRPTYIAIN